MVSVWDKNINSWISKVKKYQEIMTNERNQMGSGEYQIDEIKYIRKKGVTLNASICIQVRGGWKIGHKIRTY